MTTTTTKSDRRADQPQQVLNMDPFTEALIALRMIIVHNVEGHEVSINPDHIVSLREARDVDRRLVSDKVRCFITLVDGKYQTVIEECVTVRRIIEGARE
jgi:uncharacterized protein YlzI (FlbEa/FlbD family)